MGVLRSRSWGLSCGWSKMVAGTGTFMMASFLCLVPWWDPRTAGPFSLSMRS